ncbi:MAG: hypothetical protein ACTHNK_07105 [Thermomicrobiales bacterium]|jgi:hypothetical protein|nr:hypothetical protein [Thermomicrobiales bacterium]
MRETCFCGRTGDIADREPVYLGDGEWGLTCPDCGHLDRLELFPEETRTFLLNEARERRHGQPPSALPDRVLAHHWQGKGWDAA